MRDKLQAILHDIEEWQKDEDAITGIDLLLKIRSQINDIVSRFEIGDFTCRTQQQRH